MSNLDRLKRIINVIRNKSDWKPNHEIMKFGDSRIGYYDTSGKGEYFVIKYREIEVNVQNENRLKIEYPNWEEFERFSMDNWLKEVESIVKQQIIEVDGKKYSLIEV